MTNSLTLSLPEIVLFISAAIVLGITIRLFISMRRNIKAITHENELNGFSDDEWRSKYNTDIKRRDKEIAALKELIRQSEEKVKTLSSESEAQRWQHKRFEAVKEQLENKVTELDQLNKATRKVMQEKISLVAR